MQVKTCDERMANIKVPHDFNRTVKGLAHVKHWKGMHYICWGGVTYMCCFIPSASEYRSWVLYFSLPVLQGILPDPFFTHYALLVAAMQLLLSDSISPAALQSAEQYLHRFYEMFADLYGMYNCIKKLIND